jgi:ribonuclease J
MTSITVYDGAESIGGNKIYVGESGKGVFLDFGKNFGKYAQYYEEYLKNRDTRGIHDLLYLNLIPKLNIYRQDLLPSDVSVTNFPKLNIAAVLLSHAHLDHCGNIGLLDNQIPVVASPISIAILKGMQDIAASSIDGDVVYTSLRTPLDDDFLYLKADSSRYIGKPIGSTTPLSEPLQEFLSKKPGQDISKRSKKLEPGTFSYYKDLALPFEVIPYEVDHSIYGSSAYILNGAISIAYTGDFRLHGRRENETRNFVHHGKDANVLIIEGTRVERSSDAGSMKSSEDSVCERCQGTAESEKGLIVADFSARNFERLEIFHTIAERVNRELVITAKDAYMMHALECADGINRLKSVRIYDEIIDHKTRKWESEVVRARAGDQYIGHQELRDNPDQYIACFSFFDMKHLLDIKPEKGAYIYSSCEAFNEEMEIDFKRLWQWLNTFNLKPFGFTMKRSEFGELTPEFDKEFHASGHAPREDIAWVIDQINPDFIIPVHTENKQWFVDNFENVINLKDGESHEF